MRIAMLLLVASLLLSGIVAILAASIALSGAANAAPPAARDLREVRLKSNPTVSASTVTLGDLFDNAGPVEGVIVADAPAPGERMFLRAGYLASLARENGLSWSGDQSVRGVTVVRGGRMLPQSEVLGEIGRIAKERLGGARYEVSLDNRTQQLYVPENVVPSLRVDDFDIDRRTGRFTAVIVYPADPAVPGEKVRLTGRAAEIAEIPVLRGPVATGAVIGWNDIDYIEVRPEQLSRYNIVNPQEIVGQAAARSLTAGQPLRLGDIKKPELVARNGIVTLTFRRPGITLSLQGRATEPGALGETVRVMNLTSNKIVQAVVIGPGEVEVLAAAGTPVAQGLAARTAAVN